MGNVARQLLNEREAERAASLGPDGRLEILTGALLNITSSTLSVDQAIVESSDALAQVKGKPAMSKVNKILTVLTTRS